MQLLREYLRSGDPANERLEDAGRSGSPRRVGRIAPEIAPGMLLAVLTIYLSFSGGGFFPGVTAVATLVLCAAMATRIVASRSPFEGVGLALLIPLALLIGFAGWTLSSAAWSDSSARAMLEFDRVLLYVLTLALFGTLAPRRSRLEWGIRGLATAATVVCAAALATRLAADVFPIAANVHDDRLSFPLTYWNALGLLAALGLVACMHLTSGARQPRTARVLSAAAMPLLAAALLLTFSRGSLLLAAVGLVVYMGLARPRRLPTALASTVVPIAAALVLAYRADLLASDRFDSAAAIAQGHGLALAIALCMAGAALLRWIALPVDDRLLARSSSVASLRTKLLAALAVGAVGLGAAGALGAPAAGQRQWDRFVSGDAVDRGGDTRSRLSDAGNNGRLDHWDVAFRAWREKPAAGHGAGTYRLLWARDRPYGFTVNDGHSLYLEVLAELGAVGLLLLLGAIGGVLVGVARRVRGPDRDAHAALLAAGLVWVFHAGIDWDWEMPAVTLWLFALAGLSLSAPRVRRSAGAWKPSRLVRVVAALCIGVLALTPAAIAVSQARLDDAVAAFKRGDCASAIDAALDSLGALRVRPEPYEVIGYCDARQGEHNLALRAMRTAVSRDPNSWETHYGLAIVRSAAGLDPRPRLAIARRLNRLEPMVQHAERELRVSDPLKWERRALRARLPIK
jgi:O-antigen ligase